MWRINRGALIEAICAEENRVKVIKRDDLYKRMYEVFYNAHLKGRTPTWADADFAIRTTEDATDVRKVILCKDCKYFEPEENELLAQVGQCRYHHKPALPFGYCSWAVEEKE